MTTYGGRLKYLTSCVVMGVPSPRLDRSRRGLMLLQTWTNLVLDEGVKLNPKRSPASTHTALSQPQPQVEATPKAAVQLKQQRTGQVQEPPAASSTRAGGAKGAARFYGLKANERLTAYTGGGAPRPGPSAEVALAAAASAADGPAPLYIWPAHPPAPLSPKLAINSIETAAREGLLRSIGMGLDDLAKTHIPVTALLPAAAARAAGAPAGQMVAAAALAVPADAMALPAAASVELGAAAERLAAAEQLAAAEEAAALEAAAAAAAVSTADLAQVYRIEDLEAVAEAAETARRAGQQPASIPEAVVPDSTRPFTITMRNPKDGLDYVVAHYEPGPLAYESGEKAALLCEIFQSRIGQNGIQRGSAPANERMVMAGMRMPRGQGLSGCNRFGRYVGDEGGPG